MGSDREARPSVQDVQYRILRNAFESLTSMCVREGSSRTLGCVPIKSQLADSELINVRFGPLCGLNSDISRGPRSANGGHS
jgi:hypothetical protein